jgi:glycosyltransferase involved in cell wall biosynthesis
VRVCYLLSHYVSHRVAGLEFRDCLRRIGVEVVDAPAEADAVIIHNEPWSLASYYRVYPELREKRVIAYSVWETDLLPEHYRFNLRLPAAIWTPSSYCRDVLAQAGRPVSVVPHVVRVPAPDPGAEQRMRQRIGARDGELLFYAILNAANVRKGLTDLLTAFDGLFPVAEARLLVKSNTPLPPGMTLPEGVVLLHELLGEADLYALHRIGHCFVSAHRSEAWGLGIADAMACGNLVVATAHGGNMDYMHAGNSLPVACSVEPIHAEDVATQPDTLSAAMRWGYVDRDDLRRQLRRVFEDREALRPLAAQAQRDMQRYAPDRIATILAATL